MTKHTSERRLKQLLRGRMVQACADAGVPVTKTNVDKYGWSEAERLLNDAFEDLLRDTKRK